MKKVIIIGCGYAGAVASWRLAAFKDRVEVTVIDKGGYFNFSPLLPDSIGRSISPDALAYPIEKLSRAFGFDFLQEEVVSLDLKAKQVITSSGSRRYDYLIISSGSQTNFYANTQIEEYAYALDAASDARKIVDVLRRKTFDSFVICGGGYTGIEIATNLRRFLARSKQNKRIVIVERAGAILGPLPQWMKEYVSRNLAMLNIEVAVNSVIERIEERRVQVSGRGILDDAMVFWTAGVRTSDFLQKLSAEKNPQGRVKVDRYLRLNENCFVIGDASYFAYRGSFLRMAVQFAIAQAHVAAANIINALKGSPPEEFSPFDVGYIVPMANNRSCGIVFGEKVRGQMATGFHYFMCVFRSLGIKNKVSIARSVANL